MFTGLLSVCTIKGFSGSLHSNYKEAIKCVYLNNQPCQARPTLVGINSNKNLFYPFTVSVNKYRGSCSAIDDPYARICVPYKVKNMNVKVFNLMTRVNERYLVQHETPIV